MAQEIETGRGAMTTTELRDALISQAADDTDFRERLLADPKSVLNDDYGIVVPESFQIHVHEESPTTAHLVLPRSKQLTEAELEASSGGGWW